MNNIVATEHARAAERLREQLSTYIHSADLINIGAYKKGSSKEIDEAITIYPEILSFMKQTTNEKVSMEESVNRLLQLMKERE